MVKACLGSLRTHTNYVDCSFPKLRPEGAEWTQWSRMDPIPASEGVLDADGAAARGPDPEAKGLHPGLFPRWATLAIALTALSLFHQVKSY